MWFQYVSCAFFPLFCRTMNSEGRQSRGAFHVIKLDLTAESRAIAARRGLRVVDRLDVPPGRHQVRFAVHQPNGKTGSVVADIEVPDYAKTPLTLEPSFRIRVTVHSWKTFSRDS